MYWKLAPQYDGFGNRTHWVITGWKDNYSGDDTKITPYIEFFAEAPLVQFIREQESEGISFVPYTHAASLFLTSARNSTGDI